MMMLTLLWSLPALLNVATVLLMFMYIYVSGGAVAALLQSSLIRTRVHPISNRPLQASVAAVTALCKTSSFSDHADVTHPCRRLLA